MEPNLSLSRKFYEQKEKEKEKREKERNDINQRVKLEGKKKEGEAHREKLLKEKWMTVLKDQMSIQGRARQQHREMKSQ